MSEKINEKNSEENIIKEKALQLKLSSGELDEKELDTRIIISYVHYDELVKRTRSRLKAAAVIIQRIDSLFLNRRM